LHILKTFTKGGANSGGPPSKRPKISAPASSSKISTTIVQNLAESQSDLPLNYTLEAMTKKTPDTTPLLETPSHNYYGMHRGQQQQQQPIKQQLNKETTK
jgi:hypothetical protein